MYTLNGCHGGDGQVDPSHPRRRGFTSCKYEQNLMSSRHTVELKRREEDEECPTGSVGDANIYTYCMLHVAEITGLKRVELWGGCGGVGVTSLLLLLLPLVFLQACSPSPLLCSAAALQIVLGRKYSTTTWSLISSSSDIRAAAGGKSMQKNKQFFVQ